MNSVNQVQVFDDPCSVGSGMIFFFSFSLVLFSKFFFLSFFQYVFILFISIQFFFISSPTLSFFNFLLSFFPKTVLSFLTQSAEAVEYTDCFSAAGWDLPPPCQWGSWIWHKKSPRSTLARSSSSCQGAICGSNINKLCTYSKLNCLKWNCFDI